jgi:hypothetical protein
MEAWTCAIEGCGEQFDSADGLIEHQAGDHDSSTCKVCGESVPAGFLAIRHAFDAHTRADYLRAYGASSDDIRARERVTDRVEAEVDVPALLESLGIEEGSPGADDGESAGADD